MIDRRGLGERLKRQRERRGITLQQISHSTKVPASLFAALEAGDCSRWPAGLYARAYMRAYADAIGLNPDETVEEFVAAFGATVKADGIDEPPSNARTANALRLSFVDESPIELRRPGPSRRAWLPPTSSSDSLIAAIAYVGLNQGVWITVGLILTYFTLGRLISDEPLLYHVYRRLRTRPAALPVVRRPATKSRRSQTRRGPWPDPRLRPCRVSVSPAFGSLCASLVSGSLPRKLVITSADASRLRLVGGLTVRRPSAPKAGARACLAEARRRRAKAGGEEGIRTPGSLSTSTVFKTAALNHSATSPHWAFLTGQSLRQAFKFTTRPRNYEGFVLLTDGAVRSDDDGKARLVAIARRGGVLNQPHVIREDISGDRTSRVLIARVLVVHPEAHSRVDGYVGESDLIPIGRHRLKRDGGEGAPAGMRVSRAGALGASQRRGREIASPRR